MKHLLFTLLAIIALNGCEDGPDFAPENEIYPASSKYVLFYTETESDTITFDHRTKVSIGPLMTVFLKQNGVMGWGIVYKTNVPVKVILASKTQVVNP
jgi:hypothetical protein